jgi:hypothetical protein
LKKGTGSEPTIANAAENCGREVPVPLFQPEAQAIKIAPCPSTSLVGHRHGRICFELRHFLVPDRRLDH